MFEENDIEVIAIELGGELYTREYKDVIDGELYIKLAKKIGESSKVAIRNLRRDGIEQFKKMEKNKEVGFGPLVHLSGDFKKDMDLIQDFFSKKTPRFIEKYNPKIY